MAKFKASRGSVGANSRFGLTQRLYSMLIEGDVHQFFAEFERVLFKVRDLDRMTGRAGLDDAEAVELLVSKLPNDGNYDDLQSLRGSTYEAAKAAISRAPKNKKGVSAFVAGRSTSGSGVRAKIVCGNCKPS
jgi:hypothetical protein